MPAVYQRRSRLLLLLALAACRAGGGDAGAPAPPPRAWPLAVHLSSRAWELVDVDAAGRALANELGGGAARAFRFAADGRPTALAPAERAPHLVCASLGGDTVLLELGGVDGSVRRWALADGRGAPRLLALPETGRLLGVDPAGQRLWFASVGEDGLDRLFEGGRSGGAREVLAAPAGFRLSAVARDGTRAALTREVAPGVDEVVLADRRAAESRLVLPSGPDGRFVPLLFADDARRLLVATDDASDLARLEWLDLDDGARSVALEEPGCAAVGARAPALAARSGAVLLVDLSCSGVRRAALVESGAPPWQGRLPTGLRASAALPAGDGAWWLELAGPRSARDLARLGPDRLLVPLTWALAARLEPDALAAPEIDTGARPPLEIWRPPARPRGAVVWLEDDGAPPRWGEFHPLHTWLAARALLVVRFRPRGSGGFGRALRESAGEDPLAAAARDAEVAAARARALAGAALPVALVVEDGRWRPLAEGPAAPFALRLALAARPTDGELEAAGRALEAMASGAR